MEEAAIIDIRRYFGRAKKAVSSALGGSAANDTSGDDGSDETKLPDKKLLITSKENNPDSFVDKTVPLEDRVLFVSVTKEELDEMWHDLSPIEKRYNVDLSQFGYIVPIARSDLPKLPDNIPELVEPYMMFTKESTQLDSDSTMAAFSFVMQYIDNPDIFALWVTDSKYLNDISREDAPQKEIVGKIPDDALLESYCSDLESRGTAVGLRQKLVFRDDIKHGRNHTVHVEYNSQCGDYLDELRNVSPKDFRNSFPDVIPVKIESFEGRTRIHSQKMKNKLKLV